MTNIFEREFRIAPVRNGGFVLEVRPLKNFAGPYNPEGDRYAFTSKRDLMNWLQAQAWTEVYPPKPAPDVGSSAHEDAQAKRLADEEREWDALYEKVKRENAEKLKASEALKASLLVKIGEPSIKETLEHIKPQFEGPTPDPIAFQELQERNHAAAAQVRGVTGADTPIAGIDTEAGNV